MSKVSLGALLLLVWVLLWGGLSAANVIGGIAVIVLLFVIFPSERPDFPRTYLHPVALVALLGYFSWQVAVSTALLAYEVATPRSRSRSRIVTVPMRTSSKGLLTLVADLSALTPGTLTVAVSSEPPTITLHVLELEGSPDAVDSLRQLERLSVRTFGTREERDALDTIDLSDLPPVLEERDPTAPDDLDQGATG